MSESVPSPADGPVPDATATPAPAGPSTARNVATEMFGTSVVMLAGPGAIVLSGGAISNLAVAISFGVALAISQRSPVGCTPSAC